MKGNYPDLKTKPSTIITHNPLDLLCIEYTEVDPSNNGKENSLVLKDASTKFS